MLNECLSLVLLHPRGVEFNKVGDLLFRASGSERRQVKQLHQIGPSCIIIWTARWPVTMKNQLTGHLQNAAYAEFPICQTALALLPPSLQIYSFGGPGSANCWGFFVVAEFWDVALGFGFRLSRKAGSLGKPSS